MAELQLTPALRFPEFENTWQTLTLEKMSSRIGDGIHGTPQYDEEGAYYFVNGNNLSNGRIEITETTKKVSEEEQQKHYRELNDRTILMSINGTIGNLAYYNNEPVMLGKSAAYINLLPDYEISYVFNYLSTRKIQAFFHSELTGSTIKNLSLRTIRETKLHLPTDSIEQRKIASFLTAIDERIQLLQKKKAKLEEYKKGVMQKLFSQEIRFKEENGNDFPDWEEKKLGEIGEFKTSSVDKKIDENLPLVYLVNYMNVYRHETISNANRENLMQVSATETQLVSNDLKKGDILFTPSSETPADIGHSVVIFEDLENTLYSYHLMRFRPTIDIDLMYSHYFCNIPTVLRQISSFATGSTRFTISVDSFSKIQVSIPSLPEQKKIARFLTSLDESIDSLDKEIEGTTTFKKGLLQKMFV